MKQVRRFAKRLATPNPRSALSTGLVSQEKSWRANGVADLGCPSWTHPTMSRPSAVSTTITVKRNGRRAGGATSSWMVPSPGIGDIDGLLEQIGPQDWQAGKGGML